MTEQQAAYLVWRRCEEPTIDSSFVVVYRQTSVPTDQNCVKIYFDLFNEELIRVNLRRGVSSWWRCSPWLDAEESPDRELEADAD